MKNMKRVMVDCNTCNTENFGIDTPRFTHKVKNDCLTETCYESLYRIVKRTFIVDYEEV